jgi:hypothetical protein
MDRRDQELLEKQLRQLNPPPRHDGMAILVLVAVLLAGIALGGIWFGHPHEPMRIASAGTTATLGGGAPVATP